MLSCFTLMVTSRMGRMCRKKNGFVVSGVQEANMEKVMLRNAVFYRSCSIIGGVE